MHSAEEGNLILPKVGLFTWVVADNLLYADETYAEIYNIDPDDLAKGVEIERIIACLFNDDRERAARATHASILDGRFGTIDYRITIDGRLKQVSAYGRCLRDPDGVPSFFTGGVAAGHSFRIGTKAPITHFAH